MPFRLCTLGDLLLDVIVRLDEPLAAGTDAQAATRTGAGGQSANVAAWAASLGAEARFVGKRGDDAAGTLAANEFVQIAWEKARAGKTIRCRLGGTWTGSYIAPSEDNPNVLLMFQGKSAPQPPAPSNDTYPPGCYVNRLPPTTR